MNTLQRFALLVMTVVAPVAAFAAYPKHLSVTTPQGNTVTVTAFDDNILKITDAAAGEPARRGTASVLDESYDGERLNPDGKGMSANICGMTVSLTSDGRLTIDAGKGKKVTDSGLRTTDARGRRVMEIGVDGSGAFYGAGERAFKYNLRGDTLRMYNRPVYGYTGSDPRTSQMGITMPLFVSQNGYAIVFDDHGRSEMILSNPVKYVTESPEPVSWYFVNGTETIADVTEGLTRLTGRQELPPLWTLGYITSKYGYHNQDEAEGAIDTLKAAGYPVDGLILDLYWYGKEQDMGRLAWDLNRFHDPDDFLDYMKKRGVDIVTIAQPYVLRNSRGIANYNELDKKGLLLKDSAGNSQEVKIWVGEGGMFDVSNPDTRYWLSERYRTLTDRGLSGWWGDLGEPEVHPENAVHANGLKASDYHNRYGNDWSEIIYNLYKQSYPNRRIMTLMRAGTTGLQRYDVFPWSGDVSRSWGGLEPQIRIMLGTGLSGLGYMGHDVGGFAVDNAAPTDPELYVRWLQLGLFTPMLRTHAQFGAEPYHYPDQQPVIKQLILDRYRWLPYNYTLAWENATKGYPLVRPLNFHTPAAIADTPEGQAIAAVDDQYLWGRDVLVAPVQKKGATSRDIILPAGSAWVDFNHPDKYYEGGTTIKDYPAPLEVLPLFVREGAIIPMAEYPMKNTKTYNRGKLTLRYFPSAKVKTFFTMFEDDMATPTSKSNNQGRTLTFSGDATAKGVDFTLAADGYFAGMDKQKAVTLVVNNQNKEPRSVTMNGTNVRFVFNKEAKTVTVSFIWKTDTPTTIRLNP